MARAGEFDRRVVIEVNNYTRDGAGAVVDNWVTFATVWARRSDARGREFFGVDQVVGEARTVWQIRWLDGVKAAMRLVDGVDVWDLGVPQILGGRRDRLEISAVKLDKRDSV
jgi:SPP1 family predicted phage head-tail adaptor